MKPLQPINGYEIKPDEWVEAANAYAGAATQCWLSGLGLASQIATLLEVLDEPIEAPPLDGLVGELDETCQHACNAADFIVATLATDYDKDELLSVIQSLGPVEINSLATQRAMARIAEITLGICNRADPTDLTARAERAAVVAILSHPKSRRIADEPTSVAATTHEELITELTGVLTRLTLDQNLSLRLAPEGDNKRAIVYEIRPDGGMDMRLSGTSAEADTKGLSTIGWEQSDSGCFTDWADPVAALGPALLSVDTIGDIWSVDRLDSLRITAIG